MTSESTQNLSTRNLVVDYGNTALLAVGLNYDILDRV